jgi:hypothetical protein
MAALLEADRHAHCDTAGATGADMRPGPAQRLCKVLQGVVGGTVAVLYVFYSVDPALARCLLLAAPRPVLRIPGRWWRNAADFRLGDLLQLSDGGVAVVDKLVAAPGSDALYALRVTRMRTYVVDPDGIWARQEL